jgi:flagellar biosynthetic protein FliQ
MGPDDIQTAVDVGRQALVVGMILALPLLVVGLVVGVMISILQAATQIQEQTLTFVPKIVAVVAALFIMMPWVLTVLVQYTEDLIINMGTLFL